MVRLVDGDRLKRGIKNHCIMPIWCHELVKAEIDATPTVDAVEVVRCGKCKYFHKNNENDPYCNAKDGLSDPTENTFCSYGERRSDETD